MNEILRAVYAYILTVSPGENENESLERAALAETLPREGS